MPPRQKNTPAKGRNPKARTKAPDDPPVSWWNLHDKDFFGKHRIQLIEAAYLLHYEYSRTHTGILADVHRLRSAKIPRREEGETPATQFNGFPIAEFWKNYYPEFPRSAYWEISFAVRQQRLKSFGLSLSDNPYLPSPVLSRDPSEFAEACARGELNCSMSEMDRLRYMVLQIDPFHHSPRKVAKRILELVRERQKALLQNMTEDPALLMQVQAQHGESRGKRWNQSVILVALKELGVLRLVRELDWNCRAAHKFATNASAWSLPYPPILARWERAYAHALSLMQRLEVAWKHVNHPFLTDATSKVDDKFFFRWLVASAETQVSAYDRRAALRAHVGCSIARHREIG